jgi:hypothetical protein
MHDDTHAATACDMLNPAQGPEHALMARISLGLGPSLHQLRSRSLCLVRRLHSYYGLVRLPTPVHHRLRLHTFSMRTAGTREQTLIRRPVVGSPKFRRDPFAHDVLFDPGRVDRTSHSATAHVAFGSKGQPPPPAIRVFRGSITHPTQPLCTLRGHRYLRLTQHSLPGGLLDLTWTGLAPADRASLLGAFPLPTLQT